MLIRLISFCNGLSSNRPHRFLVFEMDCTGQGAFRFTPSSVASARSCRAYALVAPKCPPEEHTIARPSVMLRSKSNTWIGNLHGLAIGMDFVDKGIHICVKSSVVHWESLVCANAVYRC